MSNDNRNRILWTIAALFGFLNLLKATPLVPPNMMAFIPAIAVLALTLFAVLHGSRRMGGRTMLIFFLIAFVVSWCLEALSIRTGFPFGHYHYSERLGPKLGEVPLLIMPAYFAMCYLSWNLAYVVLDKFDQRPDVLQKFAVPLLAAFIMVMWDMCMDPVRSTLLQLWIWHDGGGYFGVPFSNFMGWFLCVYLIFQSLALYLDRNPNPKESAETGDDRKAHWHQVTALYGATFLEFIAFAFLSGNGTVTDLGKQEWSVRAMYETMGLVSIFTMLFVTCLAFFKVQASPRLR